MYVHYKSSFRDDGTKTRWIVNINVRRRQDDFQDQPGPMGEVTGGKGT
jgi:hypothetical protein